MSIDRGMLRTADLAAFSPTLTELMSRATPFEERSEWLRARAQGVTGTQIAKLAKSGVHSAYGRQLIQEKLHGGQDRDLSNVRAARWGTVREEFIAEWVERRFGIHPSVQTLFRAKDNPRYLVTPDGVGVTFDDELLLSEVKTTVNDLTPVKPNKKYTTSGYADQKQWELRVTGASRVLFVWERHDNDWSGWPERGPAPLTDEPEFRWIERDEKRIAELERTADEFLAALDAAEGEQAAEPDPVLDGFAAAVLTARVDEVIAAARKKQAWQWVLERVSVRKSFTQEAYARVTWTAPETTVTQEPDQDAAIAAAKSLWVAYQAAKSTWESHAAEFTKAVPVTKPGKLTVTEIKKESEDD